MRMVTGDNVITARSVAIKCGIIKPNDESLVYDGEEFNSYIRDPDKTVTILIIQIFRGNCWEITNGQDCNEFEFLLF